MKHAFLSLIPLFLSFSSPAEEVDVSNHRETYAAINLIADSLPQATAKLIIDGEEQELRGWKQEGKIVKIVAKNTKRGSFAEYYLEGGKALFVFMVSNMTDENGKPAGKCEERLYLEKGEIIQWLNSDKKAAVMHGEDYQAMAESIAEFVPAYTAALNKGTQIKVAPQTTSGSFLRIDEGDYMHWVMKTSDGEELSLFILDGDDGIDAVLEAPDKFVGKSCSVKWSTSNEEIPEFGGMTELQKIHSVSWTK